MVSTNSFISIVNGLRAKRKARLSSAEVTKAANALVQKALVQLSMLNDDANTTVVTLRGILFTKNMTSKLAIYSEALAILDNDGSFNVELHEEKASGELLPSKCRLVVGFKEWGD